MQDLMKLIAVSKGLLEAAGLESEDMLATLTPDDPEAERVSQIVVSDPRWLNGEIAFFEANFKAHPVYGKDQWFRTIGAPLAEASAVLWEGVLDPVPKKFWVKLTAFSDIEPEPTHNLPKARH